MEEDVEDLFSEVEDSETGNERSGIKNEDSGFGSKKSRSKDEDSVVESEEWQK